MLILYPMQTIKLTLLANNVVQRPGLLAEHGLAFWLECGGRRLLFDTGQGLVLRHNAATLGLRLGTVTDVIFSHGHYDHTGGLSHVADSSQTGPRLWLHPATTAPRFSRHADGSMHEIGIPEASRNCLHQFQQRSTAVAGGKAVEIMQGIFATGPIERRHGEEKVIGFYQDAEGRQADDIPDDQALWFDTPTGVVALLGCAHAGCINTLEHIQRQSGGRPLAAVIGGTHLGKTDSGRMDWTISNLRRLAPKLLVPLHCTGDAVSRLKTEFPDIFRFWGVGDGMTFEVKGDL